MSDISYVYHIRKNGKQDLDKGYVGLTRNIQLRMYKHRGSGLLCEGREYVILFKGSRKLCLAVEKALRPRPYMGANTAEGGWDFIPKGKRLSVQTEIKKGEHLSPRTEFKKGQAAHNAGSTCYILTNPSGVEFFVDNLTTFCLEHNLTRENIRKVARGTRRHAKGWKAVVTTGR